MKKLFIIALLLALPVTAYAAVAIDDIDGYVGEATSIYVKGQKATLSGSQVSILANGHKEGVTTNVSTESNLTSAALAYGVVKVNSGTTRYVSLADGTPGQMVTFTLATVDGGTFVITDDKVASADTKTGWDDITFNAVYDSVTLLYVDDTYGWVIVGQNSVTVT